MTPANPAKRHEYKTAELFGPLHEGRDCGGCTVCCVETRINTPELQKEPGRPCTHLSAQGCGIYETRFPVCREWHCLWRHIGEMPEAARPDRLGIMFALAQPTRPETPLSSCYIHALVFGGVEATRSELAGALFAMFAQGDVPLWLSTSDSALALVHPHPEVLEALKGGKAKNRRLQKQAAEWKTGLRRRRPATGLRRWRQRLGAYFRQLTSAE